MTKSRAVCMCLILLATGALSCRAAGRGEAPLSPVVDAWLHCEECVAGEREAVRARGAAIVAELRTALLSGPTSAQRDRARREYEIAHRSLGDTATSDRNDYVRALLENYVATFQKRAAIALSDIGGNEAREALQQALEPGRLSRYRDDVQTMIRTAYVSLTDQWFAGTVTPSAPAFGDTVTVRPAAGHTFAGVEFARLQGAFYPDSAVRARAASDELRFVVTAAEGQRLLTVYSGAGPDTGYTTLIVRTLADANDRLLSHCPDVTCLRNSAPRLLADSDSASLFLSLWRRASGSDTIDAFRFEPSRAVRITAIVDWRPAGEIDLRWSSCSDGTVTVDTAWTSPGRWRAARVALNAGVCAILEVVLTSREQGIVAARLQLRATRPGGGIDHAVSPPAPPGGSPAEYEVRSGDVLLEIQPPPSPAPPPATDTLPPRTRPGVTGPLDRGIRIPDTSRQVKPKLPVIN